MIKKLKDCKKGDFVKIWCIGWIAWDNEVVKVVDSGVSTLVKVEYKSGRTAEFVPTLECMFVSF